MGEVNDKTELFVQQIPWEKKTINILQHPERKIQIVII
jgi:hypothetical protein